MENNLSALPHPSSPPPERLSASERVLAMAVHSYTPENISLSCGSTSPSAASPIRDQHLLADAKFECLEQNSEIYSITAQRHGNLWMELIANQLCLTEQLFSALLRRSITIDSSSRTVAFEVTAKDIAHDIPRTFSEMNQFQVSSVSLCIACLSLSE